MQVYSELLKFKVLPPCTAMHPHCIGFFYFMIRRKPLKTSTSIEVNLLQYYAKAGYFKQFSLFIKLKAKYSNSIIFNYNINKIANRTGLSHKTCERYMRKLFILGCLEMQGNHLLLKNQLKMWSKISDVKPLRLTIETRPFTSYQGIKERLQCLLIKENNRQQEFNNITQSGITYRTQLLDGKNKAKAKRLYNADANDSTYEHIGNRCFNSSRSVGRLLNVSNTTANNVIRNLVKKNYIRTEEVITRIKQKKSNFSQTIKTLKLKVEGLNSTGTGYYYLLKRTIFHHSGLKISFLSF